MKRLFISATTLLLIGCGSGSGSNPVSSSSAGTEDILKEEGMEMSLLKTYEVYPGDTIKKLSEDVELIITHNNGEVQSHVELAEGKAKLIRRI